MLSELELCSAGARGLAVWGWAGAKGSEAHQQEEAVAATVK